MASNLGTVVSRTVSVLLIGVSLMIVWQRQAILDWWQLRSYTPPEGVAELARDTTMNDHGKRLFYVHKPQILDKEAFRSNCTTAEASIVLGCYIQRQGIYLYDVTDERLEGAEEVTAAHEMLHAAYDRLSKSERERIDNLISQAFTAVTNERVRQNVAEYKARDASVVPNELHSILATEVRDIGPELESYYKKYFDNRLTVVALSEKYEAEFVRREEEIATLKGTLEALKITIDTLKTELQGLKTQLATESSRLNALRESDPVSYNNQIPAYNQKVRRHNQLITDINSQVESYNALVEQINSLVVEEQELLQAIDTRVETIK